MTFHTKLCLVQNLCVLYLIKLMGFLEIKMELNIWHYLALKNMMPFMIGLERLKTGIRYVFPYNYVKIKIDS